MLKIALYRHKLTLEPAMDTCFGRLFGISPLMKKVYDMTQRAAEVDVPVLIEGETGTGKELVAREIHERSARKEGLFVAVNTGALSKELVASELFGHVKGAFTGATENRVGHFEEAHGGTLFLDEVATMEDRIQITLLRAIEERVFRPVGAKEDKTSDVRIIAATNVDLRETVNAGAFREDLLQRLTVFRIVLPPLRDRREDMPILVRHFLEKARECYGLDVQSVSDEALDLLQQYAWPGNVRELKNAIAQSVIVAASGVILPEHIPPRISQRPEPQKVGNDLLPEPSPVVDSIPPAAGPQTDTAASLPAHDGQTVALPFGISLDDVQRKYVAETLARCRFNKTAAAKSLGISRNSLHHKLRRWGIEPDKS